jgi:predicted DCC family thiol-disulfide oxidoreductase YuxK
MWDMGAALLLGYLLVSIHNFSPHAGAGAPAALALVLLLHAFTPGAPYGSLAARGRPDPGGRWHFPRGLYLVGWTFFLICWVHRLIDSLILGDRASGLFGVPVWAGILIVMLLASVEVVALVLSLNRRIRPYAWVVLLGMRVVWAGAVGINNANEGLLLLLLFVFNPGWIAAAGKGHEVVFYDGHCSLCQGVVRFLLAEDRRGVFRFAPIGGEAYTRMIPEEKRRSLPDSVIVLRTDGELLVRSAATLHLAERVGGIPRIKAQILNRLPRRVNDAWYELVARNRNRLFPRKESSCPLIPERHRAKMLP